VAANQIWSILNRSACGSALADVATGEKSAAQDVIRVVAAWRTSWLHRLTPVVYPHWPFLHTFGAGQIFPQWPQLLGSLSTKAHPESHIEAPGGHVQ
jgi:hypothetical protein